jgi:hypothetical protein
MTIVVNYVIIFILGCIYNITHTTTLTTTSYRIYRMQTGFILFYCIHTDDKPQTVQSGTSKQYKNHYLRNRFMIPHIPHPWLYHIATMECKLILCRSIHNDTQWGQYSLVQTISTKTIISEIDWLTIPMKCYEALINVSWKTLHPT